jgi:class 3 adenylate cyclase
MTILLFGQALLVYATYGSVTLYVTYILVANWAMAMNKTERILFNSSCVAIMLPFVLLTNVQDTEAVIIRSYEVFFFTVIAFIFDTFDSRLQENNFLHEKTVVQEKSRLEVEKSRVDRLLLSVLPAHITRELLEKGKVEAREFENVTILFTDFVGFTETSEKMMPQDLLGELNYIFQEFDQISSRYGIQKIKSIGDAYMAIGALGAASSKTVLETVFAALEMQDFVERYSKIREARRLPAFHMRVGIHSGPVIAGIVGQSNFQYDIWGDTVNVASRLEQKGTPGRINISESVYLIAQSHPALNFVPRGAVKVKGKGEIHMWYVEKSSDWQQTSAPSVHTAGSRQTSGSGL